MKTKKAQAGTAEIVAVAQQSEDDPRWEVLAPEGFHFAGMEHGMLCHTKREAGELARGPFEPCGEDCQ